nr:hypothetical protein Iba_chr12aCG10500 [Ipomoea batatas]
MPTASLLLALTTPAGDERLIPLLHAIALPAEKRHHALQETGEEAHGVWVNGAVGPWLLSVRLRLPRVSPERSSHATSVRTEEKACPFAHSGNPYWLAVASLSPWLIAAAITSCRRKTRHHVRRTGEGDGRDRAADELRFCLTEGRATANAHRELLLHDDLLYSHGTEKTKGREGGMLAATRARNGRGDDGDSSCCSHRVAAESSPVLPETGEEATGLGDASLSPWLVAAAITSCRRKTRHHVRRTGEGDGRDRAADELRFCLTEGRATANAHRELLLHDDLLYSHGTEKTKGREGGMLAATRARNWRGDDGDSSCCSHRVAAESSPVLPETGEEATSLGDGAVGPVGCFREASLARSP